MPDAKKIFSPDQLKAIVDTTLTSANIPDQHKNAVVFAVDNTGAKVIASFKVGKNDLWQIQGAIQHDWAGNTKVGGDVVMSW